MSRRNNEKASKIISRLVGSAGQRERLIHACYELSGMEPEYLSGHALDFYNEARAKTTADVPGSEARGRVAANIDEMTDLEVSQLASKLADMSMLILDDQA